MCGAGNEHNNSLLITLTVFCLEDPTNVAMFYSYLLDT